MEPQKDEKNGESNNINNTVQSVVLSLENCLIPKEKLLCSPSMLDGLDRKTERIIRIHACETIQTAGILLRLPQVAMATGQVLFQRFYYSKSFVRHSSDITAMGCVCLASKIEESPRRIRDVINVFHHIRQVQCQKRIEPLILDQQYIALKTQVIKAERRILKELGFCVHVKHPHKLIMLYLQVLGIDKKQPGLLQLSWNYMNDALRTNVFVEFRPETIACACIYLSARKLRIIMPKGPEFYVIFGMEEAAIATICKRIVRLYRHKVNIDELENRVKELRNKFERDREKNKLYISTAENTPNGTKSSHSGSPSSPVGRNHVNKRSQSRSKSPSHSSSKSKSDSSSSSRHRTLKKNNREYNQLAERKSRKIHKSKHSSYTPSPPKSHHKKYKYKYEESPISLSYKNDHRKQRESYKEINNRTRDHYRHNDYKKKHKR